MAPDGGCLGDPTLLDVDDEVFLALADRSRRIALYYLRWRRRVDVDELADVVAGWRGANRRGAVSRVDRDRVEAALLGQHLPVLADAGLVEVEAGEREAREREAGEARTVAIQSLSDPVRSLIDFAYDAEGGKRGRDARS